MNSIPSHVAIIMDGNGRWAKKRNKSRTMGHKKGVETVKKVIDYAAKTKIKHLTLYAFSSENWERPKKEVSFLMSLLHNTIEKQLNELIDKGIKLKFIGEKEKINQKMIEKMKRAEEKTINGNNLNLMVAFNYSGRKEIINAVKGIVRDDIKIENIDENIFEQYLYTAEAPDPELVIRTSGEFRVSNYLLWQIAYSEFVILDKFWPDFTKKDFEKAIEEYKKRDRRFGSLN